jgi:AcrR family transcriptional regulator
MSRTLNPAAHAIRRDAFLDAAQRLIQSKGYEEMSLQDVLDELEVSKGAFYHYFSSKEALLAAVVDRIILGATAAMTPVAMDPDLPAFEKLKKLFATLVQWKGERTELMLELTRVWISDANAVVRDQLKVATQARLTPLLATIISQGKAEGTFDVSSPDHTADVFVALLLGANETTSRLYISRQAGEVSFEEVECTLAAYAEAFERILGLRPGSWPLFDRPTLLTWFG